MLLMHRFMPPAHCDLAAGNIPSAGLAGFESQATSTQTLFSLNANA
jgi:hypothetical protein